ncbi:MAG TPA: hypothetical protein VJ276_20285 [Thermoanaerobaculia bacterium]|nr:hypothetical protein [Thermoanaerobaculia bacterium]
MSSQVPPSAPPLVLVIIAAAAGVPSSVTSSSQAAQPQFAPQPGAQPAVFYAPHPGIPVTPLHPLVFVPLLIGS